MKTRFEVEVTQADIDAGIRNDRQNCMVKVALERLIPEADHMTVDMQTIRFSITEGGVRKRVVYLTPAAPRNYLVEFDGKKKITPFVFVMEKPQITEVPPRKPGTVVNTSVKARPKNTLVRVYGECAYLPNQAKAS